MNEQNKPQIGQEAPETGIAKAEQGGTARRLARRRLLIKGGATAAPVLLSLGSKPAMATGLPCSHHKSGWASAGSRTTVDNGDHSTHSHGCAPNYWLNNSWDGTGCSKNTTLFYTCFKDVPSSCDAGTYKLKDALTHGDEYVREFAASYLNCKSGKYQQRTQTIMTEANLLTWWSVCKSEVAEASIGSDGKIRRSASYWKGKQLTDPDKRAGGFVQLMKSINTIGRA